MAVNRHAEAVAPVRSSGPVSIWATRHVSTAIGSLGRIVRQPFSSLMIILVIAVTLALPAAISLVVKNARSVSSSWDNALDFSVFLKQELPLGEAEELARLIGQRADVDTVELKRSISCPITRCHTRSSYVRVLATPARLLS